MFSNLAPRRRASTTPPPTNATLIAKVKKLAKKAKVKKRHRAERPGQIPHALTYRADQNMDKPT